MNISQIIEFPKYNFSLEKILERFPKLKERKQLFNEFKIGNEGFGLKKKEIYILILINMLNVLLVFKIIIYENQLISLKIINYKIQSLKKIILRLINFHNQENIYLK